MKLRENSKLVLTFTDSSDNIVSSAYRVVGIYQSNNAPLDEINVYIRQAGLNELLLIGNSFHEIGILLKNDEDLAATMDRLQKTFPGILVESWKEISPETQLLVKTVDTYSLIFMVIILIALSFGILNTMLMSVLERTREIGMMVALGTSRKRIFLLVFLETLLLSMLGAPVGLAGGYFLINYFERYGLDLSGKEEMMASFGFNTLIYPSFPWEKIIMILVLVIGTAIISCIYPSIKALRLQPVEALRR
jgi:ABC-type lipoprotein release transport system permease subunit